MTTMNTNIKKMSSKNYLVKLTERLKGIPGKYLSPLYPQYMPFKASALAFQHQRLPGIQNYLIEYLCIFFNKLL